MNLILQSPYELTSIQAGEVEAVHKLTTENVYKQQLVNVDGQTMCYNGAALHLSVQC